MGQLRTCDDDDAVIDVWWQLLHLGHSLSEESRSPPSPHHFIHLVFITVNYIRAINLCISPICETSQGLTPDTLGSACLLNVPLSSLTGFGTILNICANVLLLFQTTHYWQAYVYCSSCAPFRPGRSFIRACQHHVVLTDPAWCVMCPRLMTDRLRETPCPCSTAGSPLSTDLLLHWPHTAVNTGHDFHAGPPDISGPRGLRGHET